VKGGIEAYAAMKGYQVITPAVIEESKSLTSSASGGSSGGEVGELQWTPGAQQRLENIPSFIRDMARKEIERMAREKGLVTVTEAMMDEVKGKFSQYMGMGS
ncbi:MAG: PCP reductase family protein, partial [Nitrospiria bacterium]